MEPIVPDEGSRLAELQVEGDELARHPRWGEQAAAVHSEPRVPSPAVRGVEVLEDAHEPADHGFRIGERLPGVAEVDAILGGDHKIFAPVHHDSPRGLSVLFDEALCGEWVVGCTDPVVVAGLSLGT
jgi:hypothetical protein